MGTVLWDLSSALDIRVPIPVMAVADTPACTQGQNKPCPLCVVGKQATPQLNGLELLSGQLTVM